MSKIAALIIMSFLLQCNSQKKTKEPQKAESVQATSSHNTSFLLGEWKSTATYFTTPQGRTRETEDPCRTHSYWKFYKENNQFLQSKFSATGADCKSIVSTTPGTYTLNNSELEYFIDDVFYHSSIKIESDKKFTLMTRDMINGKDTKIEVIYEKE